MIRVEAPSRLHFGLLNVPTTSPADDSQARHFGGVGLMVDRPGVAVTVEASREWSAEGPLAERALVFARRIAETLPDVGAIRVRVERCPPEHVGLGVGTSLGLAVAKAVSRLAGVEDLTATELARRIGRGQRSAVGVHGFEHGGFIVEAGKRASDRISPLIGHYRFPANWRVVLFLPTDRVKPGLHGEQERDFFRRGPPAEPGQTPARTRTECLCRLLVSRLIPALLEQDLNEFGDSLHSFNRMSGEWFVQEQGGVYAPTSRAMIQQLIDHGVKGVGQSSWGPCVFAVVEQERASEVAEMIPNDVRSMVMAQVVRAVENG